VRPSIDRIIEAGSSFALDHFGVGSTSFGYLIDLKPAYLKIDGSYIRRISKNKDHQFFVQAITNIAHGLDIRMIACHVERQQDFDAVKMLGVDAVQGKFVTQVSHPKNVKKCDRFWPKLV
jgi:EAL domain-containing protein (putative c-di-GMP-specific phosphodiesterase class I)